MKLQNLFVATAILATTVVGGTTFAAEGLVSKNIVGFEAGNKEIKTVPDFSATEKLSGDTGTLRLAPEGTVKFEDFTGEDHFELRATQTGAFVNVTENSKSKGTKLASTLTYATKSLTSLTTNGEGVSATFETFQPEVAQEIISVNGVKAYGAWEMTLDNATVELDEKQIIPAGEYSTTVNWDLGETPAEVEPEA